MPQSQRRHPTCNETGASQLTTVKRAYAEDYTYHVEWSDREQEYLGTCLEFPSLSWLDPNRQKALEGITKLVGAVLKDMHSNNESPPIPKR